MKSPFRHLLTLTAILVLTAILAVPALAATSPDYEALRAARPDGRRIDVTDLVLERDVFRFTLKSGAVHFLEPLNGRTFGAVFVGEGSYLLSPATEQERRHLAMITNESDFEVLKDDFTELVLLFADDTFEELGLHGPIVEGTPDPKATETYEGYLKRQRKDWKTNFHVRVLTDLLNTPLFKGGCFLAFVEGKKYPPALAAVDPRGAQALAAAPLLGGEDSVFIVQHDFQGGIWYQSHRQGEVQTGRTIPYVPLVDAHHYEIDFSVENNEDVSGTTAIHFQNLTPDLRVLALEIVPTLRLESASYRLGDGETQEAAIIQEDKEEDASAAVVFPEGLPKDARVVLELGYAGDKVIIDRGDGNFSVGARTSWYPSVSIFDDMATFDLTYHVPAGNEVISVGEEVSTREEDGHAVAVWKSDIPVRVAGFNYGRFKRIEKVDEMSGLEIRVYSNPGTPDVIRDLNAQIRSAEDTNFGTGRVSNERENLGPGESIGTINTGKMADEALTDGLNAARVFATYFGPLPEQAHVAITQQTEAGFGQSWPGLIYLPYIAFMSGTVRAQLGLARAQDFIDEVGYHELAHQWWGHLIGWDSYRDQWLSEGFSEFSAALVLQHAEGWEQYDEHWKRARDFIVDKPPGNAVANSEAGPITQGYRIITRRSRSAYQAMTYSKGGFVLHMLRMMMRDPRSQVPDERFIAMMQDFVSTWANKNPSTADFKATVERHMTPEMNATGDGKMDWFFNQWVNGTAVPRYTADLAVDKAGKKYRIHGKVAQSEVPADFKALLPLYLEFKKGEYVQFGALPMLGEMERPIDVEVELPKKPRHALVNAHHEILAKE